MSLLAQTKTPILETPSLLNFRIFFLNISSHSGLPQYTFPQHISEKFCPLEFFFAISIPSAMNKDLSKKINTSSRVVVEQM